MANNFLFCELQKPRATGPEPPRRELSKTGLKVGGGLVLMTWQPFAGLEITSLEHCQSGPTCFEAGRADQISTPT